MLKRLDCRPNCVYSSMSFTSTRKARWLIVKTYQCAQFGKPECERLRLQTTLMHKSSVVSTGAPQRMIKCVYVTCFSAMTWIFWYLSQYEKLSQATKPFCHSSTTTTGITRQF
uniref:Uncharacterized protein n=1 Tax=Lygus hesperus TaxID=30085 RepID=A0A146KZV5_LYGHE